MGKTNFRAQVSWRSDNFWPFYGRLMVKNGQKMAVFWLSAFFEHFSDVRSSRIWYGRCILKKLTSGHRYREDRITFDRFLAIYPFENSTGGRRSHIPRYDCFFYYNIKTIPLSIEIRKLIENASVIFIWHILAVQNLWEMLSVSSYELNHLPSRVLCHLNHKKF